MKKNSPPLRLCVLLAAAVSLLGLSPARAQELLLSIDFADGLKTAEPLVLPMTEHGGSSGPTESHDGEGQAWLFEGDTALEIPLPDKELLHFTSADSFTLEAWVRLERPRTSGPILAKGSGANYRFNISPEGHLGFTFYAQGSWRSTEALGHPLPIREWTHVAAQVDGSMQSVSFLINGTLVAREELATSLQSPSMPTIWIGGTQGAERVRGLAAAIGGIRIFSGLKHPEASSAEVGTSIFSPAPPR